MLSRIPSGRTISTLREPTVIRRVSTGTERTRCPVIRSTSCRRGATDIRLTDLRVTIRSA
jgi:hypothetical protein